MLCILYREKRKYTQNCLFSFIRINTKYSMYNVRIYARKYILYKFYINFLYIIYNIYIHLYTNECNMIIFVRVHKVSEIHMDDWQKRNTLLKFKNKITILYIHI